MFVALLEDNVEYARMETPDIFRVLRKREPEYIEHISKDSNHCPNRTETVWRVFTRWVLPVLRKRQSKKA